MKEFLLKHKFLIIIALLFLILRIPSFFEPNYYGNEGIYLTTGQEIKKGATLYTEIYDNKTPLIYYFAALGDSIFGFKWLLFIWMIPTVYFFFKLCKNYWLTIVFVILTSIPLLEGNIANAENFMLLPTILAFYFIFNKKHTFWAGLLLGFAFCIKVPVIFEFIFLLFWLSFFEKFNFKKIFSFCLAFILPIGLFALYYSFHDALITFIFSSLFQNFDYLSSWKNGLYSNSFLQSGVLRRGIILVFIYLAIWFLAVKKVISRYFSFILFWFTTTVFSVLLAERPYPHYLIQTLPSALLLIFSFFKSKQYLSRLLVLISIFTLFFLVKQYNFYPSLSYYKNFYFQGNNFQYYGSSGQVSGIYKISDFIIKNTDKDDKLFIWGDEPSIYSLTKRSPVGRYTVASHISDFNGYDSTMEQLKINFPKYIVYFQMEGRNFDELDNFINRYYFPAESIGSAIIFQYR
jgi:hypothetical protein